ncbi:hypothetical protein [uncultured Modestobacter sp.]|uniref:hypothetical protein n=1 Tax=uncultured Modestobacter sp. TaxID=380048 RepID=UPI0026397F99|nr:hypothetical protein [uncultured Modestobacter sp.]
MLTRIDDAATSGTRWHHVLASDGDVLAEIEQQIVDVIHARTSDLDMSALVTRAVTSRSSPHAPVPAGPNQARQALADATAVVGARVQLLPVLDSF